MTTEEKSFIQSIWENRFIKSIVPYVIGAWGIIQVSAFLESRYTWAKGWPDFILIFALVMLPAVFLFSYYRGRHSGKLAKAEKIFIPLNFIVAVFLGYFGLGSGELENSVSKISVTDEEGQTIERIIPHGNSMRRIVMLPWENKSTDVDQQWLTFILPEILSADMEQDSRLIAISPRSLADEYDEYSAQLTTNPPFSIKRKIATDNYSDYFLTGEIEKKGDSYVVQTVLFNTKDGKEFYTKQYEEADPLTIVDKISEDFRKEVYVENELEDGFIDLPVSNLYTNSLSALKSYGISLQQTYFNQNINAAILAGEEAVKTDPNFAAAHAGLADYYAMLNKMEESKGSITKAMSLTDVLPERMQFSIKFGYMNFESPVKALSLLEMWSKLYPKDFKPYGLLINLYAQRTEVEKARLTALRALEHGHTGPLLLRLANLENAQGNSEAAIKYYDRFEKEFPHKAKDIFGKGNVYMSQGDFENAKKHFETLHLLDPGKSSVLNKLAEIEGKQGNIDKQLSLYEQALSTEKQFADSLMTMRYKEFVLLNTGQIDQYFEETKKRWQLSTRIAPYYQNEAEMIMPFNIEAKINKGEGETILEEVLKITSKLDNTLVDYDCIVKANYYIYTNDAKNLNTTMDDCLDELKKLQTEVQMNVVYAFIEKVNGNYGKAIKHLETLQSVSKLDPSHLGMFAEVYRLNKDYDKAIESLNANLKIDPYNANLLYQLALSYHENGEKDKAITSLEKVLGVWKNADADFLPAIRAKEKLAEWK